MDLKQAIKAFWGTKEADWLLKQWQHHWDLYEKLKPFLERRMKILNQLYLVYPEIQLQAEGFNGFTKIFGWGNILVEYAPCIHYRVLPCECVIEIDNLDREQLRAWLRLLGSFKIMPLVCHSGHKSWHLHFFVKPKGFDLETFVEHPQSRELVNSFYSYVVECAGTMESVRDVVLRDNLDTGVQMHVHMIRSIYSLNMKSKRVKQPLNRKEYPVWEMPKRIFKKVVERSGFNKKVSYLKRELCDIEERRTRRGKSKWIEEILQRKNIHDGRMRLLIFVVVPYLVQKGLEDSEIRQICERWISENNGEWTKYSSSVSWQINFCKKNEWRYMSKEKFLDRFRDLIPIFQ